MKAVSTQTIQALCVYNNCTLHYARLELVLHFHSVIVYKGKKIARVGEAVD